LTRRALVVHVVAVYTVLEDNRKNDNLPAQLFPAYKAVSVLWWFNELNV